jgi:hypothetical protein
MSKDAESRLRSVAAVCANEGIYIYISTRAKMKLNNYCTRLRGRVCCFLVQPGFVPAGAHLQLCALLAVRYGASVAMLIFSTSLESMMHAE